MGSIQEMAPGIFRIRRAVGRFKFSVNIYVVTGPDGLVFDTGFGSRRSGNALVKDLLQVAAASRNQGALCRVTRVVASHGHWDHFSGLSRLQDRLGVEILATEKQAATLGSKKNYRHFFWEEDALFRSKRPLPLKKRIGNHIINDILVALFRIRFVTGQMTMIRETQKIRVNSRDWDIIGVPGHCDDDIALFNRETGILLGGDLVFGRSATWLGPERSDLGAYLRSLERISRLQGLKLILPAHGGPVTDPCRRLREAIAHCEKRTDQVRQLVLASGRKGLYLGAIRRELCPGKAFRRVLAGGWISVTLRYLADRGEICVSEKGRKILFKPTG